MNCELERVELWWGKLQELQGGGKHFTYTFDEYRAFEFIGTVGSFFLDLANVLQ